MQMVENLGRDGKYYYGLFLCPECGQAVKMQTKNGPKSKRCYDCYQKLKTGAGNPNYRHGDLIGGEHSKLYWVWADIKSRATNPRHHAAKRYVLRGIGICDEWRDFANFKKWAEVSGYKIGLTIDRIDNDGDYCPKNCRWVNNLENVRNSTQAKINIQTALEIKQLLSSGRGRTEVANIVGCSIYIVSDIARGKTWRDA